jgi:hypothetical protein
MNSQWVDHVHHDKMQKIVFVIKSSCRSAATDGCRYVWLGRIGSLRPWGMGHCEELYNCSCAYHKNNNSPRTSIYCVHRARPCSSLYQVRINLLWSKRLKGCYITASRSRIEGTRSLHYKVVVLYYWTTRYSLYCYVTTIKVYDDGQLVEGGGLSRQQV